MKNKQLFEKQSDNYNPISPIVYLEDIIESGSDKSIQWVLNNYNHIYVEYFESKAITRNKVPNLFRRKGLCITYNIGNEIIIEYFKGDNKDVTNYVDWTHDDNWQTINKLNSFGKTIDRPNLSSEIKGYQYFDITLEKPIWWTGEKWVDAIGATV